MKNLLNNAKADFSSSLVVFFVALPLCLGIALASGAPLFSGLISGIIGGILVGALSGSRFGVSGPAAGLVAIALVAIEQLGGFQHFLAAVVLAGVIQLLFALLRFGTIAQYFPTAVIKGMLAGIGILIILKQIPHAFGYDADFEGDQSFSQIDGENTFTAILHSFHALSPGVIIVSVISLCILLFWEHILSKKIAFFKNIPGPLVAVLFGIAYYKFSFGMSALPSISPDHLVSVPVANSLTGFFAQFSFPDFGKIGDTQLWITALTIAVVASVETLLCLEATDKLDPKKQISPPNQELFAQGLGNVFSGFIGGLPITQVIVRSSANIQSGAKSKLSAILHGLYLLLCVAFIAPFLNLIPLGVLAIILILVGYKLSKPELYRKMYQDGWSQFIPFIATILGILFLDLLKGISIGMLVSIAFILYKSYKNSHYMVAKKGEGETHIILAEEVSFMNKAKLLQELSKLENNQKLIIDQSNSRYIDHDILELIEDFKITAKEKNIELKIIKK
ncbi:MAG: SulP family inorganic anion transporter [Chitinophagales bacterium]|nr:SulP family inorganic anion transporter [Chitinophagales bacterium]